jgi:hypothetical protein
MKYLVRISACLSLFLVISMALTACSKVDIAYSHNVVGRGVVLTDYQMSGSQKSEASGAVRGTGDVFNQHFFSTNDSSLLNVEDKFVLNEKKPPQKKPRPSYPGWPGNPGMFRLTGTGWAMRVELAPYSDQPVAPPPRPGSVYRSLAKEGEFKFSGASLGDTSAQAAMTIRDPSNLDVDASLSMGPWMGNQSFYYQSRWLNSSNVTVRSAVGENGAVVYEDSGSIEGSSTGIKRLTVWT